MSWARKIDVVMAGGLALVAAATPSIAQNPEAQSNSHEVLVFTAERVDVSKLSEGERLRRACMAATYLRAQLQRLKTDSMYLETTNELIQLSCVSPKSK